MSITVHPFDGPNLPARRGSLFLAPRIPTHRQMIRAQAVADAKHFTRCFCPAEHQRSRSLFSTAKRIGEDCAPVLNIWEKMK